MKRRNRVVVGWDQRASSERRPTMTEHDVRNGGPALGGTELVPPSPAQNSRNMGPWMEEHAEQFCSAWNCKARAGRRPNPSPSEGQRPGRRKARGWFSRPNGPTGLLSDWLGRWPERPPSHGHLDPGRCPSLGDLTPVPGSHARARNKSGINCHPCPLCTFARAGPTLRPQPHSCVAVRLHSCGR